MNLHFHTSYIAPLFVWQVAFQGTVVSIENFLAWKAKFELEMTELRKKRQKEEEQTGKIKLTGKMALVDLILTSKMSLLCVADG